MQKKYESEFGDVSYQEEKNLVNIDSDFCRAEKRQSRQRKTRETGE